MDNNTAWYEGLFDFENKIKSIDHRELFNGCTTLVDFGDIPAGTKVECIGIDTNLMTASLRFDGMNTRRFQLLVSVGDEITNEKR